MVTEVFNAIALKNSYLSRPDKFARGLEEQRAATGRHVHAVAVQVRPDDVRAAAHANVVGAVHASATCAPVGKKIIIISMVIDIRGFNRIAGGGVESLMHRRGGGGIDKPGCRIELNDVNAIPERAERH